MTKIISIINLKGGVGKTVTAINMAHILAAVHGQRVLLIDNDKQGNSSKFFGIAGLDCPTLADVLTDKQCSIQSVIQPTEIKQLDVLPANMTLQSANLEIMMDMSRQQQSILQAVLMPQKKQYDFILIDNAPDINISTINALVASDEVIVPVKVDKFAFDGMDILMDAIDDARLFNPGLKFAGCLFTMIQGKTLVDTQGMALLRGQDVRAFDTVIRRTKKMDEMTFYVQPLLVYAPKCTAAQDYLQFVNEYLQMQSR